MDYKFIVIEGNIGAGKTSLSTKIADNFNAKLILEQFADNLFLPKFYKDQDRYSFALEMSFLADRYNQLKNELTSIDSCTKLTISDYYFMKSLIFSKQTLQDDEYTLYERFFYIIYNSLPKPDLYVYLHVSVDNLHKNIKKRGRNYEQEISSEYLQKIQDGYLKFLAQQKDLKILIVDVNNIDFVNSDSDYSKLTDLILNTSFSNGINRIVL